MIIGKLTKVVSALNITITKEELYRLDLEFPEFISILTSTTQSDLRQTALEYGNIESFVNIPFYFKLIAVPMGISTNGIEYCLDICFRKKDWH